jgi:hypothetical protein
MTHANRGWWVLVGWLAFIGLAQAAMYKWVDDKGVTQYTQYPPPDRKAEVIVPPPPPAEDPEGAQKKLEATLQKLDEERKAKATAQEESQKTADEAKQRQKVCQDARSNLEKLTTGGRRRVIGPDGVASYLPEEERQQKITEAKEAIKKYCD